MIAECYCVRAKYGSSLLWNSCGGQRQGQGYAWDRIRYHCHDQLASQWPHNNNVSAFGTRWTPCSCVATFAKFPAQASAGLVTILAAKAFGAAQVTVTDMVGANLSLATQMGATSTLLVDPAAPPAEAAGNLKAQFGGLGPDIVIDCAGFESTMQVTCRCC